MLAKPVYADCMTSTPNLVAAPMDEVSAMSGLDPGIATLKSHWVGFSMVRGQTRMSCQSLRSMLGVGSPYRWYLNKHVHRTLGHQGRGWGTLADDGGPTPKTTGCDCEPGWGGMHCPGMMQYLVQNHSARSPWAQFSASLPLKKNPPPRVPYIVRRAGLATVRMQMTVQGSGPMPGAEWMLSSDSLICFTVTKLFIPAPLATLIMASLHTSSAATRAMAVLTRGCLLLAMGPASCSNHKTGCFV